MTVAAVYDVARTRWRSALSELGLDPDNEEDKFRVPRGFWFKMADATRVDLTEEIGLKGESGTFHRDVPVEEAIENFLKSRVQALLSLAQVYEGAGVARTTLRRWMQEHPGVLAQTPTKGLYLVTNAIRADELADIEAGLKHIMGH
jgi:hypothetical protein